MKKTFFIYSLCLVLFLSSCTSNISDSKSTDMNDDTNSIFDISSAKFISAYYQSQGEFGLNSIIDDSAIIGFRGIYGMLLQANTPTRMLINCATGKFQWTVFEYNKLTGDFKNACHDEGCDHDNCLFLPQNRIFASKSHIFYISDTNDKYLYMSDINGNDQSETKIPKTAILHSETENGIYWEKETSGGSTMHYSLWLYDFSTQKSKKLTGDFKNAVFFVINDTAYMQDTVNHTLYRFSEDFSDKTLIAGDITYISKFNGSLYDYNYDTNILTKLENDTMVAVAEIPDMHDWWISDGYIYYLCSDTTYIDAEKDDKIHEYLSEYNRTCGNIYRVKEKSKTHELVYHGSHNGIPDRIDNIYADGEVLYIQYRSYENFPNNYCSARGITGLVITDTTTGESIDINNECAR